MNVTTPDTQVTERTPGTAPTPPSFRYIYLVDLVCSLGAVVYSLSGQPPHPLAQMFIGVAPIITVGMWLRRYLHEAKIALPYDFGFLFLIGWPILLPVYVGKIHPEKRIKLVARLYALALAPYFVGMLVFVAVVAF